jgi:hypothetical protein
MNVFKNEYLKYNYKINQHALVRQNRIVSCCWDYKSVGCQYKISTKLREIRGMDVEVTGPVLSLVADLFIRY